MIQHGYVEQHQVCTGAIVQKKSPPPPIENGYMVCNDYK